MSEIIVFEDNLNSFLRGLETKSMATGSGSGEFSLNAKPWFFDKNSNDENFFLKHAQVLQTSLQSINISIPKNCEPIWCQGENLKDISAKTFKGEAQTTSIILKDLIYSMIITNDMKRDIQLDLENYFVEHIKKIMNNKIIDTILNGEGGDGLKGILKQDDKITGEKYQNNPIKSIMALYTKLKKDSCNNLILIMNPEFYNDYLLNIMELKSNIFTINNFIEAPIYQTNTLEECCLLIDLQKCLFIAYNPNVIFNQKQDLFYNEIGIKSQIGIYCTEVSKCALSLIKQQ